MLGQPANDEVPPRRHPQLHLRIAHRIRQAVILPVVARTACRDDVEPGIHAAPGTRNQVISREPFSRSECVPPAAAVDATIAVAEKQVLVRQGVSREISRRCLRSTTLAGRGNTRRGLRTTMPETVSRMTALPRR